MASPLRATSRECESQYSDQLGPLIYEVQLFVGCTIHLRQQEDVSSKYTYLCEDFYMNNADEFDEEFESLLLFADEL